MKKTLLLAAGLLTAGISMAQDGLISSQPEGELRTFHGYSMAIYPSWGFASTDPHDGLARQVVFADNGDVYFKDPISKAARGTWIKGTLKDGIITVETPQVIDYTTSSSGSTTTWTVQRMKGTPYYDDYWEEWDVEWEIDSEKTAITYKYDGNTITQDEEYVKLCLMADGEPMSYGDYNVKYTAVDETAAHFPENEPSEKWSFFYNTFYGHQVDVAFSGDELFVKGFWTEHPNAVIKGKIEGDKLHIPSRQYLGYLTSGDYGYYVYLMSAEVDDSDWMTAYISSGEDVIMDFDKDNKTLKLSSELIPVVRYGMTEGVADYNVKVGFNDLSMSYIDQIGRPSTPEINRLVRYVDTGWGYIEPLIYPKDEFGNALDINYLYYCVWMDNEVYVIDPADAIGKAYEGVEGTMTEVPYTFDNTHGITTSGSAAQKYLAFYNVGFTEIGAQSIYYDPETGNRLVSPIIYRNMDTGETRIEDSTVGVGQIGGGDIETEEYFDLAGNKVRNDFKGISLKVTTFADGSRKTDKIVRK